MCVDVGRFSNSVNACCRGVYVTFIVSSGLSQQSLLHQQFLPSRNCTKRFNSIRTNLSRALYTCSIIYISLYPVLSIIASYYRIWLLLLLLL
mmetsp:Transcript_35181/g.39271  ORF Transcript_35181/g.39271 Transcript_35181/m.39271 type:complete len:92 (-) Transcript_35181:2-277(-)